MNIKQFDKQDQQPYSNFHISRQAIFTDTYKSKLCTHTHIQRCLCCTDTKYCKFHGYCQFRKRFAATS